MSTDQGQPLMDMGNNSYPQLNQTPRGLNQPQQNQGYPPQYQNQPQQNNNGWNNMHNQNNQGNQGWNNQMQPMNNQGNYNQGYQNNGPNYGQQPMMPNQQMMPIVNKQKLVIIKEHSTMACTMCGFDGVSAWRQRIGCAIYTWCACLLFFTWVGFWIPFCIDSCYDTEVYCSRCGSIKSSVQANVCC